MEADITIGGIRVTRDVRGNVIIICRGNGQAHVQAADFDDLVSAIAELARTHPKAKSNGG